MQNQNSSSRLGIDLGGTKIEIIVMEADGSVSQRQRCATPRGDYQASLNAINGLVNDICASANLPRRLPIGIGTPGAISLKTGLMMNCNSTCLNDQPLVEDLEKLTGRRVRIANDADCFTLSEASDGAAKHADSVFGVILGTGVGGGIVIDQRLHQGVNAISGEWGHNTLPLDAIDLNTPPDLFGQRRACFCGRFNCVETLEGSRKETVALMESMTDLIIPERMWFTTMDVKGANIAITGVALDERTVADFMVALQKVYSNVTLKTLQQTSVKGKSLNLKNFSLSLTKKQPEPAASEKAKKS